MCLNKVTQGQAPYCLYETQRAARGSSRGCGSILCVCGSLEIVRQFAGVPFRLSENTEQHLPRYQILVADLADESGVKLICCLSSIRSSVTMSAKVPPCSGVTPILAAFREISLGS